MGGLEPGAFYARFSGDWRADADAVEQARETLRAPRAGGGLAFAGGRAGERERRGRAGSIAARERLDPATVRLVTEMALRIPERLTVLVDDSAATVVGLHTQALVLPFGEDVTMRLGTGTLHIRAKWDGAVLVLEREIGVAAVVDRLEPVADGQLLLTRRIALGRMTGPQAVLAYRLDG
jgi:hypothetical protein